MGVRQSPASHSPLPVISVMGAFALAASGPSLLLPASLLCLIDNSLHLHSLQGFVAEGLLDNFLNLFKAFSSCGEHSHEIANPLYDREWKGLR
jgi:hypothetical protein